MNMSTAQEYQFLVSILGENDENSPYRIIDIPSMGIDLFFPIDVSIPPVSSINGAHTIVDMNIKARLLDISKYNSYYYINTPEYVRINLCTCPFILTANPCILNTPLRITNIGGYESYTIDTIKLGITNLSSENYIIRKYTTIAKLSHPTLALITMKIVQPNDHIFRPQHLIINEDIINNDNIIINNDDDIIINNDNIIINSEINNSTVDEIIEGIDNLNI